MGARDELDITMVEPLRERPATGEVALTTATEASTLEVTASEELPNKPTLTEPVEAKLEAEVPLVSESRVEERTEQTQALLPSTEIKVVGGAEDKPVDARTPEETQLEPAVTLEPDDPTSALAEQPPLAICFEVMNFELE